MAVEAHMAIRVTEGLGFGIIMDQAGEPERGPSWNELLKVFVQVSKNRGAMLRRYFPHIIKHAVNVSGGFDGMGENVMDMIPAGCEPPERFELGEERRKQAEGVQKHEMLLRVPLGEDQKELVPHSLRR